MAWRQTTTKGAAVLLMVVGTLFLSTHAFGMFKVCLFSPVKGKVVLKGQPVVGAVIERSYDWAWKNQKGRDETTTDQNGEFSLPAIYGTMVLGSVLPHEPVIEQDIMINHEGTSYKAWHCYKREYEEFGELRGELGKRPITLYCDLQSAFRRFEVGGGYSGIGELKEYPIK
jgi:hypothetical protein